MQPGENLEQAIQMAIWHELSAKLHTALPARVNAYDPSGPTVEAEPMINKKYLDGTELEYLPISSVPVVFPRTNKCSITFPLERGDGVLLIFSERSLETWLKSGKKVSPQDRRKFAITDAIAIPGLFALGKGKAISDSENMEISTSGVGLHLNGSEYNIAREKPVKDLLTALHTAFSSWVVPPSGGDGGAALKTALASFISTAGTDIAKIASPNNKVG